MPYKAVVELFMFTSKGETMIYHKIWEFNMDGIRDGWPIGFIGTGEIAAFENKIYYAKKDMVPLGSFTQQELDEYGYVEWEEPSSSSTMWEEVEKDCNNCFNMVTTVSANGNEYTYCPYMYNHMEECNETPPYACQQYDMITQPSLPVIVTPNKRKELPISIKIRLGIATKEEINNQIIE